MPNELTNRLIDLPVSRLRDLRAHIKEERDFNQTWIVLHLRDGHPGAAQRRREIVAERDAWLGALDMVLLNVETASAEALSAPQNCVAYEKP